MPVGRENVGAVDLTWHMPSAYTHLMKTVRLFRNGRSQAVRLPKELRFEGVTEVRVSREGKNLILEPIEEFSWSQWWESWSPLSEDFLPEGRQQPPMQKRDLNFG